MPELPEVETVRRGLEPAMQDAAFSRVEARRKNLRFPLPRNFVARLEGRKVTGLGRRAKYLLLDLSSGEVLLMHLGMSGSLRLARDGRAKTPGDFHHPRSEERKHDHIVFHMSTGFAVIFNDPRRFGFMKLVPRDRLERDPSLRWLGPEPLGNAFSPELLAAACRGKKANLKAVLSDQRVVAGLGNIYVCEALHRARLSPKRRAATIADRNGKPNECAVALVAAIRDVLEEAIAAGGSSLRDHRRTNGELGEFQHRFRVYDREGQPCVTPGCHGKVRRIVQAGRSTFYCPICQR